MHRQARLVLAVALLVILPTAVLSLIAARNLQAWELLQEQRLESSGLQAIRAVGRDVCAALTRAQADLARAVAPVLPADGGRLSAYALLAEFRRAHPLVRDVVIVHATAGVVYPSADADEAESAAASRWAAARQQEPEISFLRSAWALRFRSRQPESAVAEYERIVQRAGAFPEIWCESALEMSQCLRQLGRTNDAAALLLRLVRYCTEREESDAAAGSGERPRFLRDDEGYLYRLTALRELAGLREAFGPQSPVAAEADVQWLDQCVRLWDEISPRQRATLKRYLGEVRARWATGGSSSDRTRIESFAGRVDEAVGIEALPEAERAALERAVRQRAPGDGGRDAAWWLQTADAVYCIGGANPSSEWFAGCRVSPAGLRALIVDSAKALAEPRGIRIAARDGVSADRAAGPASPSRLGEDTMPFPFGSVWLEARALDPEEQAGRRVARLRLYAWGVVLLTAGVMLGVGFVVRRAADDIREAGVRTDFVASVSHELRTPLSSMRLLTESLYLGHVQEPEKQKRFLEVILKETDRLWRLIEKVLLSAKMGQGSLVSELQTQDLVAFARAAADAFAAGLGERGHLSVATPEQPLEVRMDAAAMAQVLWNLLDNAAKYSPEVKDIRLEVAVGANGREAVLSVSDRGIGMDSRALKKIFRKFYRVRSAQTAGIPGVGLGLALCRHIVKAHGGRMEVDSEPGQGSTFRAILPLVGEDGRATGSEEREKTGR